MTVNSDTSSATYTGNAVTTVFPVPFYFLNNGDLIVQQKVALTGVVLTLTLNSDYAVTGAGSTSGGAIITDVAPAVGDQLYIARDVDIVQLTSYPSNSPFPASSHETALDRLTMVAQQIKTAQDLSLQRSPLGAIYDLESNTLINSAAAVNPTDVPNLQQVLAAIVAGAAPALALPVGSNSVGFLQTGTGAIGRTLQDKNQERISAKDYGVKGDGTTLETAALAVAAAAAIALGKDLLLPAGTYIGVLPSVSSSIRIVGEGIDKTIVRRPAAATGPVAQFSGTSSSIHLEGITFDANRGNNSNQAHAVTVNTGVTEFHAERCRFTGGKGFGLGLSIGDNTANKTNSGLRRVTFCQIDGNDGGGAQVSQEDRVHFLDNEIFNNGSSGNGNGLTVAFYTFPPVANAQREIIVARNQIFANGSAGCFVLGSTIGGTSAQPNFGVRPNANNYVTMVDNQCYANYGYGLVCQADGAVVSNNISFGNGNVGSPNVSAFAGILVNSASCTVTGNVCIDNSGYGIDMGGSAYFTCNGNYIGQNALRGGGGFIGLNLGACQYGSIVGNILESNGPTGSGVNIMVPGYDGGTNAFASLTANLHISDNTIVNGGGSSRVGIKIYGGPISLSVTNNHIQGGTVNNAILIQTNAPVQCTGNVCDQATMAGIQMAAAAGQIIPDWAETVFLTGTASTTNISTVSQSALFNKVVEFAVTNVGSGYNPASPPAVTISGGGGTGATATAAVTGGGTIANLTVTNAGSGYTSAPTVTIAAPPSGVTATATAIVNCNNAAGRKITFQYGGAVTLNNTNNIVLPTSSIAAAANSCADFIGNFDGKYYLRSRTT